MSKVSVSNRLEEIPTAADDDWNELSLQTEPNLGLQLLVQLLHRWLDDLLSYHHTLFIFRLLDSRCDLNVSVVRDFRYCR